MALRFKEGGVGYDSNLSLFESPPIETATDKTEWIEYRPVTQITKGSTIEFYIPGTSNDYVDLKHSRLFIKCKITKHDGSPVEEVAKAAFINLPLHSLFRQVDVALQQHVITPSVGQNYPYKAIIDTLLSHERPPYKAVLQSELFFKDSANYMDSLVSESGNAGLMGRAEYTDGGKSVDLEGPICMDICQQERLIMNGVSISIKLFPNTDPFVIMGPAADKHKYSIEDAKMKICHVKVNPGVMLGHAAALKKNPALYPHIRSDIKAFNIPQGSFTWNMDDIYQGSVPSRVVVGLVGGQSYSGSYEKNPFNFQHYNLNFISFEVDGSSVPGRPLQPNYKENNFVSSYLTMVNAAKQNTLINHTFIDGRYAYPLGYCLYVFDVKGKQEKQFMNLLHKGHTRLSIRFDEALKESVTAVVYSHFPAILQIDEARNIINQA